MYWEKETSFSWEKLYSNDENVSVSSYPSQWFRSCSSDVTSFTATVSENQPRRNVENHAAFLEKKRERERGKEEKEKKKKNRLRVGGGWFPEGERVKEAAALSLAHLFPAAIVRGIRVIKRLLLDPLSHSQGPGQETRRRSGPGLGLDALEDSLKGEARPSNELFVSVFLFSIASKTLSPRTRLPGDWNYHRILNLIRRLTLQPPLSFWSKQEHAIERCPSKGRRPTN